MSATVFYVLLVAGAVAVAPLARLIPTGRDAMILPMALIVAVVFSVVGGSVIAPEMGGHTVGALLAALALAPLYIVLFGRFARDGGPTGWGSSDYGSSDSGCGDSGDGDGGSCD